MHDATKVKLGANQSSDKVVTIYDTDPATNPAGFAVSLASTGAIAKTASSGMRVGVSFGRSLSDVLKTAVCRIGSRVPLRLQNYAVAKVTITSYANLVDDTDDTLTIGAQAFTAQAGAATLTQPTFQAATSNTATATSLAAQINAHVATAALVTAVASGADVYIISDVAGAAGEIPIVYDDVDGTGDSVGLTVTGSKLGTGGADDTLGLFSPSKGATVYIDSVSGEAVSSLSGNAVVSGAWYSESGIFTGLDEDGAEVPCAIIEMPGGL